MWRKVLRAAWLTVSPRLHALICSCSGKHSFSNLISLTLMDDKGKSRQCLLSFFPGLKDVVFLLFLLSIVCEKKMKNLGDEADLMS